MQHEKYGMRSHDFQVVRKPEEGEVAGVEEASAVSRLSHSKFKLNFHVAAN